MRKRSPATRPRGDRRLPTDEELAQLPPEGGERYNRLVFENSPYLLQHAANPVDWHPWGEEAFRQAEQRDRPIFLSIGYSTCRWCHVMERESFEDPDVADLLNRHFIAVKVDREERPDVDSLYMDVCMALHGSGGWPLTVVLTPSGQPFFAGTYFPPHSQGGAPGLQDLLAALSEAWHSRRSDVVSQAESITKAMQTQARPAAGSVDRTPLERAREQFAAAADPLFGGFGNQPKFPAAHNLMFLLRYWHRENDRETLDMVTLALDRMRMGGLFDHVGFGFHRYATDRQWLVPHFEKMLYDQALLTMAYAEAYAATGRERYRRTAKEVLAYVLRDMTSADGAFFSAEDAESEAEEGKFYLWTEQQWREALGAKDAGLFGPAFGIRPEGNFREERSGQPSGTNIAHLSEPLQATAEENGFTPADLDARWEQARQRLFAVREQRVRPAKDDKVLTGWNGLMIAAMAQAARLLGDTAYATDARRCAEFILHNLQRPDGALLHCYRKGRAAVAGFLDDYAFVVWGLIELYEATYDVAMLEQAVRLNREMLERFQDPHDGGLFFGEKAATDFVGRRKEVADAALPSGNSVALQNLCRLWLLTGDGELQRHARSVATAFLGPVARQPMGHAHFLSALDMLLGPTSEIVIAGDPERPDTQALANVVRNRFLPRSVVLLHPLGADAGRLASLAPHVTEQLAIDGNATAYVCRESTCRRPVHSAEHLRHLLDALVQ